MSNPFNSYDEAESPFVTTEAEAPVSDSTESVVEAAPAEPTPEPGEAQTEAPAAPEEAPEEEVKAPEEQETPAKDKAEVDPEELEKEAETRLADPKSPKWYKNVVNNVYQPKIDALSTQLAAYEPLEKYGKPEEVVQKLDLLDQLDAIRSNPTTGIPERSTEGFVKTLYDKDPQTAYQLINDLSQLPSPTTQGYTVLQEMFKQVGIDPARLEEVKTFAANGYQLQQGQYPPPDEYELAQIPEHLRATYSALSPERRESLIVESEHVRNEALEDAKLARDAKQRESFESQTREQKEAAEKAQREQEFARTVDTKATEHFSKTTETVFTNFVESLAKQAGMTNMDSLMIANTVLNSFEPTLAGRQSQEMLKAEGIEVDPVIQTTIGQLEENAKHIAYFEAMGDKDSYTKAVGKQVELQERLAAKGNKIIAALALKKAKPIVTPPSTAPTTRHATAGVGASINSATSTGPMDLSDESYLDDLRASGFGARR